MSNYTAETPARCPKCGGALTERTGRSMGEVVYMYDCDHCDWDDEYARADRLTVSTAPWSRDLWAEVERVRAERDAAAAKERAAVVAWLRLGCAWGVLDDYTPDQAADAIEAGDHLEATRA